MADNEIRSQEWVDKIERLVRQAESLSDPVARSVTIDLLRAVLDFHAAALERILDIVFESGSAGEIAIHRIASESLTSSVLLLHDLHPDDLETRISRAVEKLQESFRSLGAIVSVIAVEPGTLRLHFESQRSWSPEPVRASIEKEIFQAAPEITTVILEGMKETAPANFVPVSDLLASLQI